MSIKTPLTLAGIEPATFRFVAQHLNQCATAVMGTYIQKMSIPNTCLALLIHFVTAIRFKQTIFARGRHAVFLHSRKTVSRTANSAGTFTFTFTIVMNKPPTRRSYGLQPVGVLENTRLHSPVRMQEYIFNG
jgi:hypothetical protein